MAIEEPRPAAGPAGGDAPLELSRVRLGETLAGAGGVVLLLSCFLKWYGLRSPLVQGYEESGHSSGSTDAWTALSIVHWLILIVGLLGLALLVYQAACRAPAVPVCIATVIVPLSLLLVLILINRVFISVPGGSSSVTLKIGAPIGVAASVVVLIGAVLSLREDGIRTADGPQEIETFRSNPAAARA